MVMMCRNILVVSLVLIFVGCDSGANDVDSRVVEGVDLEVMFAPARPAEIQAVLDDWSLRDVSVQGLEEVAGDTVEFAGGKKSLVKVVSHLVAGVRHFGAIAVPVDAVPGSLPVLVYNHGGNEGENIDITLTLLSLGINTITDQFVFVVPSFRDEPLTVKGITYQSEGPASPWDYDVDDALALLNVALETTPAIDPERIGAFGLSRGGGVALLMAIRDPRIELVSEFFGLTDFFVQDIEDTVAEALRGQPRMLPGLTFLDANYIQPLKNGAISIEEARMQLVKRSAVLFADRLPVVQIQHGEADNIVVVDHALSLAETLQNMGRDATQVEVHLYPGAGHSPFEMIGSLDRLVAFMTRLVAVHT